MLEYNEIKERKIIIYENEPCEVLESHVARTQQRKPQNQVKLKSLLSGRTWNTAFHAADKAVEADITKKSVKFLYESKGEFWFCDAQDPKDRFELEDKLLGMNTIKFLQPNTVVEALIWTDDDDEEKIINIKLPIKMEFLIKEAPPAIKGASANSGNKVATLENGTAIQVPLFVEAGEKIRVNTETGEYVERVS